MSRGRAAGIGLALLLIPACDRILPQRVEPDLPPIEAVRDIYRQHGIDAVIAYNGNVVELRVQQPAAQLQRGGSLWARLGPYVFLFSPATRDVFQTGPAIAAVRVLTFTSANEEIARALLARDTFDTTTWQRTLNLLGIALRDGTERPTEIERLVQWGERHTEHTYNPRYVPAAAGGS